MAIFHKTANISESYLLLIEILITNNGKGDFQLTDNRTNHSDTGNSRVMPRVRINVDSQVQNNKDQKQQNPVVEAQKQISSQETTGVPPQDWTSQ
jgi:hypothetical protein